MSVAFVRFAAGGVRAGAAARAVAGGAQTRHQQRALHAGNEISGGATAAPAILTMVADAADAARLNGYDAPKRAARRTLRGSCPVRGARGGGASCCVCDNEHTDFTRRVLHMISNVPEGHFTTYKEIALALRSSPRAVGQVLRRNCYNDVKYSPRVPCHRVLSASLFLGGFSGVWDANSELGRWKRAMLEEEGVRFDDRAYVVKEQRENRLVTAH